MNNSRLNQLKLDSALKKVFNESRSLNPANIYMKRGTVIKADHHRIVKVPSFEGFSDTRVYVGIGPGLYRYTSASASFIVGAQFVHKLRDFYGKSVYVPNPHWIEDGDIDATGWREMTEEEIEDKDYWHIKKSVLVTKKFKKILTMNPENIKEIKPLD
jgi:hypothetical protein